MSVEDFLKKITTALELSPDISLTVDTSVADYWDSLGQINVIAFFEKEFGIILKMDELFKIRTVQDLIAILESRNVKLT